LAFAIGLTGAVAGAKPAADAAAERILEALRAANAARSTNAEEAQGWRIEQERLRLVQDTVDQQIARFEAEQASLRDEISRTKRQRDALAPEQVQREALSTLASAEATRLEDALDALATELPPGTIPARTEAAISADDRLQAALRRLELAEKNARSVAVELASGQLDDAERSVELLRVGGVLAWWRSLDGQEGGVARMTDGALVLERRDPMVLADISKAADIAKGRQAPALVSLPIDHARRAETK